MKADVNEIPVLQPRRLQDGAKVTGELITSNQVIISCPASATKTGAEALLRQPEPRTEQDPTLPSRFPANLRAPTDSLHSSVWEPTVAFK